MKWISLNINQLIGTTLHAEAATRGRCSLEKVVLKNFANFTGKCLCWSLFLITFIKTFAKIRLQHWCFPVKFVKFSTLLIHGGHAANADVIAVVIWGKSSSCRRKNVVARVLRFSKKEFFFRTQISVVLKINYFHIM